METSQEAQETSQEAQEARSTLEFHSANFIRKIYDLYLILLSHIKAWPEGGEMTAVQRGTGPGPGKYGHKEWLFWPFSWRILKEGTPLCLSSKKVSILGHLHNDPLTILIANPDIT